MLIQGTLLKELAIRVEQEKTGLNTPTPTFKQKRKQDAQDLAELIYDMFVKAEFNSEDRDNSKEQV